MVAVGGTSVNVTSGTVVGCGLGVLVSVGIEDVGERVMVGSGVFVRVGVMARYGVQLTAESASAVNNQRCHSV